MSFRHLLLMTLNGSCGPSGLSSASCKSASTASTDQTKNVETKLPEDDCFLYSPLNLCEEAGVDNDLGCIVDLLGLTRIPETAEEQQEFLAAHIAPGKELLDSFNSTDQFALERNLKPDQEKQEVLELSSLEDLKLHLGEVGIAIEDIKDYFADPIPVFAGLLAKVGLTSRLWYQHAVNPRTVFNSVLSQL